MKMDMNSYDFLTKKSKWLRTVASFSLGDRCDDCTAWREGRFASVFKIALSTGSVSMSSSILRSINHHPVSKRGARKITSVSELGASSRHMILHPWMQFDRGKARRGQGRSLKGKGHRDISPNVRSGLGTTHTLNAMPVHFPIEFDRKAIHASLVEV